MTRQRYPETFQSKRLNKSPSLGGRWLTLHEPSEYPPTACMHGSSTMVSPLTSSMKDLKCRQRSDIL